MRDCLRKTFVYKTDPTIQILPDLLEMLLILCNKSKGVTGSFYVKTQQ